MPIPILMSTFINSRLNNSSSSYWGMIASAGVPAVIGAGWAIAHYVYNRKCLKEDERFRTAAYKEYIEKTSGSLRTSRITAALKNIAGIARISGWTDIRISVGGLSADEIF